MHSTLRAYVILRFIGGSQKEKVPGGNRDKIEKKNKRRISRKGCLSPREKFH